MNKTTRVFFLMGSLLATQCGGDGTPSNESKTLAFVVGVATGTCGETRVGGVGGSVSKQIGCGSLNIGGGSSTLPEGPATAGSVNFFDASACPECTGSSTTCPITHIPADDTNRTCSDEGCMFGPPLPIANPEAPALSNCVLATFASPVSGTLDVCTGMFSGSMPLSTTVVVTGNLETPCPTCVEGVCDPNWRDGSGELGFDNGKPCTAVNELGNTYDCMPGSPSSLVLPPFVLPLTPITTGTETLTGPLPCAELGQVVMGAFGDPAVDYIEVRGAPAGLLTDGSSAVQLSSAYCIPASGNPLIDGAGGLPGPSTVQLTGTFELF